MHKPGKVHEAMGFNREIGKVIHNGAIQIDLDHLNTERK